MVVQPQWEAYSKGVFGMLTDSRQQKYEIEMAREARNNEFAIKFQESLNSGDGGAFTALLAGCSRSLEWARSHSSHASQQFSHQSHYLVQQTLQGKENRDTFRTPQFSIRASQFGGHHRPPLPLPNLSRVADDSRILFHTRRKKMMIDRVSVAGISGTAATFGLSTIDTFLGIAVGAVTLVYMCIKLYQELKK